MKLLLRHYEKLLLIVFLLIFLISLLWLLRVASESKEHRTSGVEIHLKRVSDYQEIDSSKYEYSNIFYKIADWTISSKRGTRFENGKQLAVYTDFMSPFEIVESTSTKAEGRLIPYEYYKIGVNPITNEKLTIPNYYDYSVDSDKDSIPDVLEEESGMHKEGKQFSSVDSDIDNDSFSNSYEYSHNVQIDNPKSHPPFISRIILKGILKNKLPIVFRKVIEHGDDKKNWIVQTNIDEGKETRKTLFLKIGSNLEYGTLKIKLLDIIKNEVEMFNPGINKFENKAKFEIKYESRIGTVQETELNKPIYTSDSYAVVQDLYNDKTYNLALGDSIDIGDSKTGIENYKLIKLSLKAKGEAEDCAIFEKGGKQFFVYITSDYKKPISR